MPEGSRQRFKSQYGQKSIHVSEQCPTHALDHRLGRTHVGRPEHEVEAMVRDAVAKQREGGNEGWTPKMEKEAVKYALWRHRENRAEYGHVMGGGAGFRDRRVK